MSEALLSEILLELKNQNAVNADLWSTSDIATYLKMSKSHVYSRVVCKPTFPRPFVIPTTDAGGAKRWAAKEVKDWVKKFRKVV